MKKIKEKKEKKPKSRPVVKHKAPTKRRARKVSIDETIELG